MQGSLLYREKWKGGAQIKNILLFILSNKYQGQTQMTTTQLN